jgi:hypothetical protein
MEPVAEDLLYFIDIALDGMVAIVTDLGDELANQPLDLPGSNSPFAILTHCLGVMSYWGGQVIAGRAIHRDRSAEFRATGSIVDLVARVATARDQLRDDLSQGLDSATREQPKRPYGPQRDAFQASTAAINILE